MKRYSMITKNMIRFFSIFIFDREKNIFMEQKKNKTLTEQGKRTVENRK